MAIITEKNSEKKRKPDPFGSVHFEEEDILRQEQEFIDYYMTSDEKGSMKTLFKLYRSHIKEIFLSCLFYVIKTSPTWVIPIVSANIIDIAAARPEGAVRSIIVNVIFVLVMILQNLFTTHLHVKYLSLANRSVEAGLRGAIVRKLQQLSLSFHKEMQSGRIQSKIMRDVEAVEALASQVFVSLLGIILNIAVTVSVIITKSMTVFAFFVVSTAVATLTMQFFRKKIARGNRSFRIENEKTSADVMDMVALIPVTKAHALEDKEIAKMSHRMNSIAEKGYQLDILNANFGASTWIVFSSFQILCLAFSGIMAYNGKISIGDIALYQSYFATVVASVSSLISLLPSLSRGMESVNSIGEILRDHDVEDNDGKKKMKKLNGEYELKNVFFSYEENKEILSGLNLKINAGETIALVGGSGAGKSTVLNMIIGFMFPDKGTLTIDGNDIKKIDLRSYRSHLAVVPQEPILFSGTIRDNITYGMNNISEKKLREVIEESELTELVNSLPDGLETKVGEHGGKLSGGQRQRISIARAIIRNPDVILFDEATSALDSVTEQQIQNAIDNLTSERTTFIVAHRLSTIRNADKIAVLDGGKCVEYGSYDELMAKKGEFFRMREMQTR